MNCELISKNLSNLYCTKIWLQVIFIIEIYLHLDMFCILLPHANFNACMLTASQYFQYFDFIYKLTLLLTPNLHTLSSCVGHRPWLINNMICDFNKTRYKACYRFHYISIRHTDDFLWTMNVIDNSVVYMQGPAPHTSSF